MSFKKKLAILAGKTFVPELFHSINKKAKIVFYHGVVDYEIKNKIIQANQMSFSDFKKQIDFFEKKFNIISIDEFADKFENKELEGNELVITFDDGYQNNLTVVAPYLKRKNIPFTVFICPELSFKNLRVPTYYVRLAVYSGIKEKLYLKSIDKAYKILSLDDQNNANKDLIDIIKKSSKTKVDQILDDIKSNFSEEELLKLNLEFKSEQLLGKSEILQLANEYDCTIASHCNDHTILHSNQPNEIVESQLLESKKEIEALLGECKYFAFPNGNLSSVSDYSIKKTSEIYRMGFAVNGKNVAYDDHRGYVSRFSLAPDFNAFKMQVLVLSNLKK